MQKTIECKMSRVIDTIKINNELVVYSDKLFRDGNLIKESEGISIKKNTEKINFDDIIEDYMSEVRKNVFCSIGLFEKGIKNAVREFAFGSELSITEFEKHEIKKPYTYLKNSGMSENVCLMYLSHSDHNLYDENFNIQPKAIYFNHIYSRMNNLFYNLTEVAETLSKRNDIQWLDDKLQITKEPKIKTSPHYISSASYDQYLEFIWCPSDDDFEKIKNSIINNHVNYDEVCEKVFGLSKSISF